ncbi:MAG: hypothetical protein ACI4MS_03290 [Candidatus Coproplasma sp.]
MTEKEKYEVLLGELAEKLKEKNDKISLQNWQIEDLKKKLADALPPKKPTLEIRNKE